MARQGLERREVLRVMALAAAASRFPGFHRWAFACGHVGAQPAQVKPAAYTSQFFTPEEYSTVECQCACATLIPMILFLPAVSAALLCQLCDFAPRPEVV